MRGAARLDSVLGVFTAAADRARMQGSSSGRNWARRLKTSRIYPGIRSITNQHAGMPPLAKQAAARQLRESRSQDPVP